MAPKVHLATLRGLCLEKYNIGSVDGEVFPLKAFIRGFSSHDFLCVPKVEGSKGGKASPRTI